MIFDHESNAEIMERLMKAVDEKRDRIDELEVLLQQERDKVEGLRDELGYLRTKNSYDDSTYFQ